MVKKKSHPMSNPVYMHYVNLMYYEYSFQMSTPREFMLAIFHIWALLCNQFFIYIIQ